MRKTRGVLLIGIAGVGLCSAPVVALARPAEQTTVPDPADPEDTDSSGEIVVTAQRREQDISDVSLSISVLPGEQLDQSPVQGVAEALGRVPGVSTFPFSQGGGTFITMRGTTASGPLFGGSSPVAYYLDSVPFGLVRTAIAPDASAYDLERVEVLRGPQGTLYGANAQSGVVRVLTRDPSFDGFGFKGRLIGSLTRYGGENGRVDAAVNLPLIDDALAARGTISYQRLSGWIDRPGDNNANDLESLDARLKLRARIGDRLTATAIGLISRSDYGGVTASNSNQFRNTFLPEETDIDYDLAGLRVDYDLGSVNLTSMTSYLNYRNNGQIDAILYFIAISIPLQTRFDAEVFSQELVANSTGDGPLQWSFGAFYRNGRDRTFQQIPGIVVLDWTDRSESYAFFGEGTYWFERDVLGVTLGGRYFHDNVSNTQNPTPGASANLYFDEATFDSWTPRAVVSWHPGGGDSLVYASYSEGFRSGAPQAYYVTGGQTGFPAARPDRLRNYELGFRGNLAGGLINIDSSIYYLDWQDTQLQLSVNFSGVPVVAIVNSSSASGFGADLGITLRPARGLRIGGTFSWNNLTLDEAVLSAGTVLFNEGDRLNFSPKYIATGSIDYVFPLTGNGVEGQLSASANYASSQSYRTIVGGARSIAGGADQFTARASAAVQWPNSWRLSIFVDNVTNEQDAIFGDPFGGAPIPSQGVRVRPRTFGAQVEFEF